VVSVDGDGDVRRCHFVEEIRRGYRLRDLILLCTESDIFRRK